VRGRLCLPSARASCASTPQPSLYLVAGWEIGRSVRAPQSAAARGMPGPRLHGADARPAVPPHGDAARPARPPPAGGARRSDWYASSVDTLSSSGSHHELCLESTTYKVNLEKPFATRAQRAAYPKSSLLTFQDWIVVILEELNAVSAI